MANLKVKVKSVNGILQNQAPISIKGTSSKIVKKIENIGNVNIEHLVDGATLVYNALTQKFDIKKLPISDLDGDFNLDQGEF